MNAARDIDIFINKFVKELEEENAAIFAGAGLSISAGFVSWKGLLTPIAHALGLNIDAETDLISIAQYHLNEKQSRSDLNQELIEQFSRGHVASDNHRILARLPIKNYWTTNYDKLIEDTLTSVGKIPDVKYTVDQLKNTKPKRDALVYKMHGDIDHPDDAVLTKDDYERYSLTREPFATALRGDLVSKTFLFLGFSFTDPNLDYILSRVRLSLQDKPRQHYCILKRPLRDEYPDDTTFQYATLKLNLQINDLKRFGVQTLQIDRYEDLTAILRHIEDRFRQRTIFISGAAHEYGDHTAASAEEFIRNLSREIILKDYKIVSGFGLGVGSHVITGVLQHIYENSRQKLHDQLLLRPFPQGEKGQETWEAYRKDMIGYAGVAIFLFGNKIEKDGKIVASNGLRAEFEIAKTQGLKLIPIGATGFMAHELWNEINGNIDAFHPGATDAFKAAFAELNDSKADHIKAVITLLDIIKKG